ncbi:MAG: nuclear transport factor 2 family protein [Pseudomonadota bacterium]
MGNEARGVIQNFWHVQNNRDYAALVELFTDDAVLQDPIMGIKQGIGEIKAFMETMNVSTKDLGLHFETLEISGDSETAWCRWVAVTQKGRAEGCGIYKTSSGKISYYRDYYDVEEFKKAVS